MYDGKPYKQCPFCDCLMPRNFNDHVCNEADIERKQEFDKMKEEAKCEKRS